MQPLHLPYKGMKIKGYMGSKKN